MELSNLFSNTVTMLIALGLVLLPSLFAWFNLLACWEVFDNVDNLTIAVANCDESYTSDLFPLELNIGDEVVSSLQENDSSLNWVAVSEEEAIEGAKSGKYYAAVVIPRNFTRSLLTFYEGGAETAKLTYYENDKINAIAPKFTTQGADSVSFLVNESFAQTIAEVSLNLANSLNDYLQGANAEGAISAMADRMDAAADEIGESAQALELYATVLDSSQTLAQSSSRLIASVRQTVSDDASALDAEAQNALSAAGSMVSSADSVVASLDGVIASLQTLEEKILSEVVNKPDPEKYRQQAAELDSQIAAFQLVLDELKKSEEPDQETVKLLEDIIASMTATRDTLNRIADDIESGGATPGEQEIRQRVDTAVEALSGLRDYYASSLKPKFESLSSSVNQLLSSAEQGFTLIDAAAADTAASAGSLGTDIGGAASQVRELSEVLAGSADKLHTLAGKITEALETGDSKLLHDLLSLDPESLAQAISMPVEVERTAVFPVENFGSAMAPLYSVLALFIGALLLMVCIRPGISSKVREALGPDANLKPYQEFMGHYGIVCVLAFAQSTVLALGNLLFLQVQAVHPLLFLLCYWVSAQVFAFMSYALVVAFENLGKGLMVVLLIMQVTGCGGSYPMQLLPSFVQTISPYLPATHVVTAMRAAMFGMHEGDFALAMAKLLLFLVPAALLGFLLRKPTVRFMQWYLERVRSSKIVE